MSGSSLRRGAVLTLLVGLLVVAAMAVVSADVLANLKSGGFDSPGSDSVVAGEMLSERFPDSQPKLVLLVDSPGGLDGAAAAKALEHIGASVDAVEGARVSASYDSSDALRGADGQGVVLVTIAGDEDAVQHATAELRGLIADSPSSGGPSDSPSTAGSSAGVTVRLGGIAAINDDLSAQAKSDVILAETIAIPVTLVLLFFVFRGVVAALVPVVIAGVTIVSSLGVLNVVAQATSVSLFAVNLVTALGLGLAVDYCLLFLTRYREERAAGASNEAALRWTRRVTGRTIIVSGAIVASALSTLFVFDQYFLRSFAIAGLAVVVCTVVGVLLLLPAGLFLLGDRIDRGRFRSRRDSAQQSGPIQPGQQGAPARQGAPAQHKQAVQQGAASSGPSQQGGSRLWYVVGDQAYRRPWLALPVIALLVVMAVPFLHAQFGVPDERSLPVSAESRLVTEQLRSHFRVGDDNAVTVVTPEWKGTDEQLRAYAEDLSSVTGVTAVLSSAGRYINGQRDLPANPALGQQFRDGSALWLQVQTDAVPYSVEGGDLVSTIRSVRVPSDSTVVVGGLAAQMTDITASIAVRLPIAAAIIVLLSLTILFLFTGSVLLPVKALVLNVVGLVGILGGAVFVFQDGHFSDVLGFTASPIAVSTPILLFCIAFGLSMDYEVFLLARIQENFLAGGDLRSAVRDGLGASGPVISAAAIVLVVSFFAMATSGISLIKMFGLSTGVAIIIDAVLIRGVLVPALMRIAGRYNWWAPGFLTAIHQRIGLKESRVFPHKRVRGASSPTPNVE